MEDNIVQVVRKWIERRSEGFDNEMEALTLDGMQVEAVQKGYIRCRFVIPKRLSDDHGNWHVGAMATLIDAIGAAVIFSCACNVSASVTLDVSSYSLAKAQEEVWIEAKVVGQNDKLFAAVVEIKKKGSGEMIALGKLRMSSVAINVKSVLESKPSKL